MTRPNSNISEQLLQQCQHRFRSLEVELNDAVRHGSINAMEYAKKLAQIQQIGQKLASLEEISAVTKSTGTLPGAIDLPLLGECTRVEQKIIHSALVESLSLMGTVDRDLEKLLDFVRSASMEEGGWFKVARRLSWLRTRMSWAEQKLASVRAMRGFLENFIRKMTPQKQGPTEKVDLVDAFREFETTTSRITNLKTRLRSELARNHDQEQWLKRYDANRRRTATPMAPPSPAEILLARQDVAGRILTGVENSNERLIIAKKLADSLTVEQRIIALEKQAGDSSTKNCKLKKTGKGAVV